MEIFGALCSADQLEIMQGGVVQAQTSTVMMFEELQMTSTPQTGKLCNGKQLQCAGSTQVMARCDYPQKMEKWYNVS